MHFIYTHTQITTKLTNLQMLEDGWMLPVYCIFCQDFKPVAQVDENKTEMLFICSHEVRQWQHSMFNKPPSTKQRQGGRVSPQRPLSLIMPYFFLYFYLLLAFALTLYIPFFTTTLFLSIFLISQAPHITPPSPPSLLSVTGWKQKWDKEMPKPIQGVLVKHPWKLVIDTFVG